MNVSSVSSYLSMLTSTWNVSGTSSTQDISSQILALAKSKGALRSTSGDTAELSFSGLMMANGLPPTMNGGPPDDGLKELIDKVAEGTATDAEVEDLATKLKELATRMQERFGARLPRGLPTLNCRA